MTETQTMEPKANNLSVEDLETQKEAQKPKTEPGRTSKRSPAKPTAPKVSTPAAASKSEDVGDKPGIHPCGLPTHFVTGRGARNAIVNYVNLHNLSHAERQDMEVMAHETKLYKLYKQSAPTVQPDRKMVIGAMRLWAKGYPEVKDQRAHINTMKLEK